MAATLKLLWFVRLRPSVCQATQVRWRKKVPNWRDPKDLSWAQPLFDRQKMKDEDASRAQFSPPMVHMVMRVRTLHGRPYWEKETMKSLGLDEKQQKPVIHKNTTEVNKKLESVKHLIKIVPVTFPQGLPTSESDFHNCVLHPDGRLVIRKTIHPLEEKYTESADKDSIWKMDGETLKKAGGKLLSEYNLSAEYFPAKYVYRYNQDGKEHRYTGDHNIGATRDWY